MPIVDTVVLFAAADDADPFHAQAVACMDKLGGSLLLGTFSLTEFDVVLKSRGFSPKRRREEMILMMLDFPSTLASTHRVGPKTLFLASLYEEEFGLDYFDSLIAAEATEHDSTVVSSDREFDRVPGLRRMPLD